MIDISAKAGHVVPTALVHHGIAYIANLGVFGPADGAVPNESVWTLRPNGKFKLRATGLEKVLGLAFRGGSSMRSR